MIVSGKIKKRRTKITVLAIIKIE